MIDRNAEAFIEAVDEMFIACSRMGIKPPTSINFATAQIRNTVAAAALSVKLEGGVGAGKVTVMPDETIQIDGIKLGVKW